MQQTLPYISESVCFQEWDMGQDHLRSALRFVPLREYGSRIALGIVRSYKSVYTTQWQNEETARP